MITTTIDKKKWNELLQTNRHSLFQTTEWIEAFDWKPVYLVNNDWSGAMVFLEKDGVYESMPWGCYGGLIGKLVNINELLSTKIYYIRIVDYFNKLDLQGWDKKILSTYLIKPDYKMSHGRKDDLRKSKDLKIEETADITRFYQIYLEAMKQFPKTIDIKPKSFFDKIPFAKFYVSEGACSVHLFYQGEIFNYISMALPAYRNSGILSKITKNVLDNNEFTTYNYGAGISNGNTWFKKSWGAEEYRYNIYGLVFNIKYEYE